MDSLLHRLRAAGERTRLRILYLLRNGEMNVKDTTRVLGQSQPRVSRHLKLLSEAGLIERYREGSSVFYRLNENGPQGELVAYIIKTISPDNEAIRNDLKRLDIVRDFRASQARDYFDSKAREWDRIRKLHITESQIEDAMLEMAGSGPFSHMLDMGTGTGHVLELFAPRIKHGTGIDLSHEMLAIARANLGRAALPHCQLRHGDLCALPCEDCSQDLVTIHQVLHFFDDPRAVISEAARVLAPDGKLLIVDFAPHDLEFLREEHAHRRLGFSAAQMSRWLAQTGMIATDTRNLHRFGKTPERNLTVSLWLCRRNAEKQN